jgi:hypothetical protein
MTDKSSSGKKGFLYFLPEAFSRGKREVSLFAGNRFDVLARPAEPSPTLLNRTRLEKKKLPHDPQRGRFSLNV